MNKNKWGTGLRWTGYLFLGIVLAFYKIYWFQLSFWLINLCVALVGAGSALENKK